MNQTVENQALERFH